MLKRVLVSFKHFQLYTMKLFCIPGFGVDDKIFNNLSLNADLHFINWLDPLPKETLHDYAARMAASIDEDEPVILGISFGGMIAQEIAKQRPVKQIILVSSVKSRSELPRHLKTIGMLRLDKLFPVKKVQQSDEFYKVANKRLGAVTKEEQEFANVYRKNANLNYVNWSFDKILNWKNTTCPEGTLHIHGNRDRVFPIKTIKPTHIIEGGTHMMVWNRAGEISSIINEALANLDAG